MINIRSGLFNWFILVLTWVFFTNIFVAISGLGLRLAVRLGGQALILEDEAVQYLYSNYRFFEATLFGVLFGTVFYLSNHFIERSPLNRKSFWKLIAIKSGIYIGSVIAIAAAISGFYVLFGLAPTAWTKLVDFVWSGLFFDEPFMLAAGLYFVSLIILTNFLILTSRKFGPGNLFLIFMGRYHPPKVEDRIFMFIDLKASTTYAEKLGHIRYSKLIQSCFHDLNKVVMKYKAEIYQYVGDEAALTWKLRDGIENLNCIRVFFAFRDRINAHASYYKKRYGMVPEFKAGLNAGTVTVAEVGDIKREIAYHGDVVNTVARIQHLCNDFNVPLIATEEIMDMIETVEGYRCEMMGSVMLKGKQKEVAIYAIY